MRTSQLASIAALVPPNLRRALRSGLQSLIRPFSEAGSLVAWHAFAPRPRLDTRAAARELERLGIAPPDDGAPAPIRAVAHVAFHFVPSRLPYLREVVESLAALPLARLDIVVDTNSARGAEHIVKLPQVSAVEVWDSLEDPLKLTWVHRKSMAEKVGDYDLFLYLEDDILIPPATMLGWLEEAARLGPHGFVPGLVRVEHDRQGRLVLSDFEHPLDAARIVTFERRRYLANPFPYQACWLCDAGQMQSFVASPSYPAGVEGRGLGVRERVAVGAIYDDIPEGFPSRALVPLTDDLRIAPEALIFHMPSNYGRRLVPHSAGLGTVRLANWLSGPDARLDHCALPRDAAEGEIATR
jgi:hypothetical protein